MDILDFISFVRSVYKTEEFIPLHEPRFIGNEKEYVTSAIESTFVSSVGAFVDKFEHVMTGLTQTKKAVATVNGTAALEVALRLAGVKSGDEVITQAFTFVATANAIRYNGADPVFIDIDKDTLGLSSVALNRFFDEYGELRSDGCYNKKTGRKIAACVPMHTFGFPVHIFELLEVCKKWNVPVVEDAAEALGSEYERKPVGSFGDFGIFSFNGNKIVTAGGGGALVTNNIEAGNLGKHLTTTAKAPHKYDYYHDQLGYNYRMPNLNAALIYAQLENLEIFIENKRKLAERYADFFGNTGITFRKELKNTKANYWLMTIELEDSVNRDEFLKITNENGIMTRPAWRLLFELPMYQHCIRDDQSNAIHLQERIVNIPSSVLNSVQD